MAAEIYDDMEKKFTSIDKFDLVRYSTQIRDRQPPSHSKIMAKRAAFKAKKRGEEIPKEPGIGNLQAKRFNVKKFFLKSLINRSNASP